MPYVRPGSLSAALQLVGRGKVATVVGRLRPEVVAVDVDAGGAVGDLITDAVTDWCRTRGLWHLVRRSGGAAGRCHVLIVPGVHRGDLESFLVLARAEMGLSVKKCDLRTQIRPLSAPHRTARGVVDQDAVDEPRTALAALQDVLGALPVRATAVNRTSAGRERSSGPTEALRPLPRPRRDLPDVWADYLVLGRVALIAARRDIDPGTRSGVEAAATFQLVVAGYTEAQAWQTIVDSAATAFPKAKSNGRRWWWNQWNRAVLDADAWLSERRRKQPLPEPLSATLTARQAAGAHWHAWNPQTRHVDREVLDVILARMDRTGSCAVAVPQRDLVLDAAVSTRSTVRASLRRLQDAAYLTATATYVPGTTDTANTIALHERFTNPVQHAQTAAAAAAPSGLPAAGDDRQVCSTAGPLPDIDPTRCQPPQRRLPTPLRRALGLPCAHTYDALAGLTDEHGSTLDALAEATGTAAPGHHASPKQLRSLQSHLDELARLQLAVVDEHGTWRATTGAEVPAAVRGAAEAIDAAVRERVASERNAFRLVVDVDARRARWEHQRATALARYAKALRARQRAWWGAQPPRTRSERRTALSAAFSELSPFDQARHKYAIAVQRARAGEHEPDRYAAWLAGLRPGELAQRSLEHATRYASRPRHDQQQLVASWTEHRARWGLPHHRDRAAPAVHGRELPERDLLQRDPPTLEDLVLFDMRAPQQLQARTGQAG